MSKTRLEFWSYSLLKTHFFKNMEGLKKRNSWIPTSYLSGAINISYKNGKWEILSKYQVSLYNLEMPHILILMKIIPFCQVYIYCLLNTKIQTMKWLSMYAAVDNWCLLDLFYFISSFKIRVSGKKTIFHALVPAKTYLLPATNDRKTPCGTLITHRTQIAKEAQHHKSVFVNFVSSSEVILF